MAWTSPRTWTAGELVTANMMNTHVRDNSNFLRITAQLSQDFRGLYLRSHPDADKTTWVEMIKCDEVVTDGGTRVTPRVNLAASSTQSGASGIDSGSVAASTWYSIQYIFKGYSSSTPDTPSAPTADAILLHREPDFSVNTSFVTTTDASRALRLATSTATDRLAQGIKFANSGTFSYLQTELLRTGSVSGRVWFSIQADSAGNPSGTPLATTDKLDAAGITTSGQLVRFIFRSPFTTSAATQYHLVLEGDYTRSDTVNVSWRGVAAGGYADGSAKEYNGTSWSAASGVGDFNFSAIERFNLSTVTLPVGYTEKSLLGYAYNGSGNTFGLFSAVNKHVSTGLQLLTSSLTATVPTLTGLDAFVPPVPVRVYGHAANTGLNVTEIGGVPYGYGHTVNLSYRDIQVSTAIATGLEPFPMFNTETQALYASASAGTTTIYINGWEW